MSIKAITALAGVTLKFGEVERATRHPDGRKETDTTHTVMLAFVATDLALSLYPEMLDVNKIRTFALVHDLPEVFAGDVCTLQGLTEEEVKAKKEREAEAVRTLEMALYRSEWLLEALLAYELQEVPEARWVRYVDKILPKLTHRLNGAIVVSERGMNANDLFAAHEAQGTALRDQYPEFGRLGDVFDEACYESEQALKKEGEA